MKDSEKWLNDQSINLMNKATTYHSTHFVMEIVNLVPLVVSWENLVFSPEALRAEIVSYLEANLNDPNGTSLNFCMDVPFSNYLNRMSIHGTFGDEILRAADELFSI